MDNPKFPREYELVFGIVGRFREGGLIPKGWPADRSPGPRYHAAFSARIPSRWPYGPVITAGRIWGSIPWWEPHKLHPMFQVMADRAHESPARAAEMCALLVDARLAVAKAVHAELPEVSGSSPFAVFSLSSEILPPRMAQSFEHRVYPQGSATEKLRAAAAKYRARQVHHARRVLVEHFAERPNGLAADQLLLPTSTLLGVVVRTPTYYGWGSRVTSGEWAGYLTPRWSSKIPYEARHPKEMVLCVEELTQTALTHKGYTIWDVAPESGEEAAMVLGVSFCAHPGIFGVKDALSGESIEWPMRGLKKTPHDKSMWVSLEAPFTKTEPFQGYVKSRSVQ